MFKKIISLFLAVIMVCSGLLSTPFYANAQEETTSQLDSQVQAQADNALAGVLADAINEEQQEQRESIYRIINVLFDGWTADVDFFAPDNSQLIVAVFDEESNEMLTMAQADVDSSMMHISLQLPETEMPQHYITKAFLLDENNLPLSESYVDTSHTQRMEEFYAKTIYDFDTERVINADVSTTNNFAVVSDNAILIESAINVNHVTRNDYSEGIFVFENADSTVKNLKPGDVFYVDIADYILVKVGSTEVNGNTVTIHAADTAQTSELFSFIKIDTADSTGAATGRVGESYANDNAGKGKNGLSLSQKFYASVSESLESDKLKANTGITANVSYSLTLSLDVSATGNLTYYYDINWGEDDYLVKYNCDLKIAGTMNITVSGAIGFEAHILDDVSVPTPIAGLEVYIDASLSLMAKIKLSTTGTISVSQNKGYHRERNTAKNIYIKEEINDKPVVEVKVDAKIEGEITLGFTVQVGLKLLKVIRLYLEGGASITAKFSLLEVHISNNDYGSSFPYVPWDEAEEPELVKHECTICLIVDLSAEITVAIGFKLSFKNEDKQEDEKEEDNGDNKSNSLLDVLKIGTEGRLTKTFYLGKFRASVYNSKLEFEHLNEVEQCPHIKHLVTLLCVANNNDNKAAQGISVKIEPAKKQLLTSQKASKLPSVSATTDAYGKVQAYLPTGTYKYSLSSDLFKADEDANVEPVFDINNAEAEVTVQGKAYKSVSVSVVDLAGNPVSNAQVICKNTTATTSSSGTTTMKLPFGSVTVTASISGFVGETTAEINNSTQSLTVVVDVGNTVTITVVNEHGKPIAGANILDKTTDANGQATIILTKGTHNVLATFNDFIANTGVTVEDKPVSATIVMEIGTKITFIAKDADGNTLSGISIDGKAKTDSNGQASIWMKDGDYTINITEKGMTASQDFTVSGEELTIEFVLQYPPSNITYSFELIRNEYVSSSYTAIEYYYRMTVSGSGSLTKEVFEDNYLKFKKETFGNNIVIHDKHFIFSGAGISYLCIEEVIISEGITYIGSNVFNGYDGIKHISIPDGVTFIGAFTFSDCTGLTSVTIPDSLMRIGDGAFAGCTGLSSIAIPDGVTYIGTSTFLDCTGLSSITIPDSVTAIGKSAFVGCTGLTSITIPENITSIGNSVFQNCTSLEKVYWNAVAVADFESSSYSHPFTGVGSAEKGLEVIFGDAVEGIPAYAFYNCANLSSVTIPDSVTTIGKSAFSGCTGLTSIIIPDGVTTIGNYAFSDCTGLTSIIIPDSVTTIGNDAFSDCTGLTSVIISDSVTSIGSYAFAGCTGLTSITIPDSVTSIGSYAFSGCTGLTSITIPENVTSIENYAFQNCTALEKLYWNAVAVADFHYNSYYHPLKGVGSAEKGLEVVFSDAVERIPAYAFDNCTNLSSVTSGDGVTSIGDYAFRGCTGLTSITIPDSVTTISYRAFYGCTELTSVTIGESVTDIGETVFQNCTAIEKVYWNAVAAADCNSSYPPFKGAGSTEKGLEVIFGDAVEYIPAYTFYNCANLSSVTIGDSVVTIGGAAFSNCVGLTSIAIPDSVTTIGASAFSGCTSLTSITIPENVTSIENYAFQNCNSLEKVYWNAVAVADFHYDSYYHPLKGVGSAEKGLEVVFSDAVERIPAYAFDNCTNLSSITIPENVTNIGENAFRNCTALEKVYWNAVAVEDIKYYSPFKGTGGLDVIFGDAVEYIPAYAFDECVNLSSVTIGNRVTAIGYSAFSDCTGLTNITIPDSVTSIGNYAFDGCTGLTSITIPDSVTSIGNYAFYGCTGLTSITIPDSVTTIGKSAFYGCTELTSVTIGESVTDIGENVFQNCTALEKVYWNAVAVTDFTSSFYALFDGVGSAEKGLKVVFGDAVEHIPAYAFYNCTNLSSVTMSDSVTTIGNSAFSGCMGLTSITIPDSVTTIGYSAFSGCTGLTSITIPENVTKIVYNAFQNCTALEKVYWNAVAVEAGYSSDSPFKGAGSAEKGLEVIFGDAIERIPAYVFYKCDNLSTATIGDSVTTIGRSAFSGCTGLTSITIPDSVTTIDYYAFNGCTGLTRITIPDSVTTIGYDAFYGCNNLQYVQLITSGEVSDFSKWKYVFPSSVALLVDGSAKVDSMALKSMGLSSVYMGGGMTKIPASALKYCSNIRTVTIDSTVTEIGAGAFYESGVTTVNFLGTEEQWNSIVIGANNEILQNATINFNVQAEEPSVLRVASVAPLADNGMATPAQSVEPIYRTGAQPATRQDTPDSITLTNAVEGMTYVMFILRDAQAEAPLTTDNLLYIDQQIAQGSELTFNFALKDADTQYTILFSGAFVYVPDCDQAGHTFGTWTFTLEPTCVVSGTQRSVCTKCLVIKEETVDPNGHANIVTAGGYDATCWDDGLTDEYTCSVCGFVTEQEIIPAGHNYSDWVITDPTDTTDGSCVRTCEECDDIQTQIIRCEPVLPMNGSTPVGLYANEITYLRFTPTADGTFTIVSENSSDDTYGYVMDADKKILAENDDGDSSLDFALTFTFESGKEYYIAIRNYKNTNGTATVRMECPHSQIISVDAKAPTCMQDGNTAGKKCTICQQMVVGETIPATGNHIWDDGVVTKQPTTEEYGEMTFTCTSCGVQKTQVIEKLQSSFTDSETVFVSADGEITALAGSSAEEMLAQAGEGVILTNKDGEILTVDEKVGTGATLLLADGTRYEIIVPGDGDGDGAISSGDARFALRVSVALDAADALQDKACNVDRNAGITSSDARSILRAAVGLDDPSDWLNRDTF